MTKTLDDFRNADLFDSRDVIERIEELEATGYGDEPTEEEYPDEFSDSLAYHWNGYEEWQTLTAFADKASSVSDWQYGETFIADSYFETYAQELAEELGLIPDDNGWPLYCIDWERAARELRMDYTSFELDGVTFWVRS